MDDSPNPPLHFANRLIRRFVDNLLGPDMVVLPADYTALRAAYRAGGGSWERLVYGDIKHTRFIEELIKVWGKRPERIRKTEMH